MKDLRDFMLALEREGELVVIDQPVDPVLEMTEVADRVVKAGGPALLFRRPVGSSMPVFINQFGSERRMSMALRTSSLEDLPARVRNLLDLAELGVGVHGAMDKLRMLSRLKDLASLAPSQVRRAPCQEVVYTGEKVNLDMLPVLKCWPLDGGRFITLPVVFTRDPRTGRRNAGMYRLQIFDRQTTGMHWHIHKDAAEHYRATRERLEVAVAIGTDPAVTYAATAPLPRMVDEMLFAGFLRDEPVEMARCVTVDLEVPAHSEIVLEGYVDVDERRLEGPFGDHTGYYSLADQYPVFHLTALTHRRDPIYAATIVGIPPMEDSFLGKATERLFLPLLQLNLPEVADMDLPVEGGFHNCAIVSVRKAYPLHARKVMHAIWGMGQLQFTKSVIVVDEGVNVHNYAEVAWRTLNNVDPARDIIFADGPLDVLDHSAPKANWGSKIGIDATKKWAEEGYDRQWPDDIAMSAEVVWRVDAMWDRLGIPLDRSATTNRINARKAAEE